MKYWGLACLQTCSRSDRQWTAGFSSQLLDLETSGNVSDPTGQSHILFPLGKDILPVPFLLWSSALAPFLNLWIPLVDVLARINNLSWKLHQVPPRGGKSDGCSAPCREGKKAVYLGTSGALHCSARCVQPDHIQEKSGYPGLNLVFRHPETRF